MPGLAWSDRDDIQPASVPPLSIDVRAVIAELETQPGRWAEIARYPLARMQSARSRGSQTVKRYPVLEYAVTQEGADAVLYFRVPGVEQSETP